MKNIIFFSIFSLFSCNNKSNNIDEKLSLKKTIEEQGKQIPESNKNNLDSSPNNKAQIDYLDIVKKYLKKTWNENDKVGKIYEKEGDLFIEGKEGGNLSIYSFSNAKILEGDLNNDDKDEHIVIVTESGGNVEWSDNFIIYNKAMGEFDVKQIMDKVINPPKNNDGCYFEIENIKKGFLFGTLRICTKRGQTKYDDIWEEIKTKCRIIDNKLELVN